MFSSVFICEMFNIDTSLKVLSDGLAKESERIHFSNTDNGGT